MWRIFLHQPEQGDKPLHVLAREYELHGEKITNDVLARGVFKECVLRDLDICKKFRQAYILSKEYHGARLYDADSEIHQREFKTAFCKIRMYNVVIETFEKYLLLVGDD